MNRVLAQVDYNNKLVSIYTDTDNIYDKEDDDLVKEVSITVRRNLEGYPLAAHLTNKERIEIRDKINEACKQFTGQ